MRIYKKFTAIIVFVLILNIAACHSHELKRYEAQFITLFDTVTQIVSYMESKDIFSEHANQIYNDLEEFHKLYDIYNSYPGIANIKSINDMAGQKPVKVDRRIIDLLFFSKEIYQKTNGKVNIALGSVLSIWHNYRERGIEDPENSQLPTIDLLREAALHTDIDDVIINEQESTIFLRDPGLSLDVGAIAKGYAVEQAARMAIKRGFVSGLISVGGNVKIIGTKYKHSEPWNIGIQNPDLPTENSNLYIVYLADKSLVTSGNYRRYYTVNGKNYHHIINPDTLYPANYYKSVTVVCEGSGMADALSTAIYNMTFNEGLLLIESLPDTEAFWLLLDDKKRFSSGFEDLLNKKK